MTEPPGAGAAGSASNFAVPLSDDIQGAVSFQRYGAQATITGVELAPLVKHRGENGWFAEVFRLREGEVEGVADSPFHLRQVSAAYAEPGRINAFHIHPKKQQDELWIVVQGALTVWLIDCRSHSATNGVRQRVQLSAEEPARLHIPAGVAHGYRAGPNGGLLMYGMNQQFDPADPNEGRLAWDYFGGELWAEDRG